MYTNEERERRAYQAGNITLAAALAAQIDAEDALAGEAYTIKEAQIEIAHLKRILADALADDSWRERAQAAIAE